MFNIFKDLNLTDLIDEGKAFICTDINHVILKNEKFKICYDYVQRYSKILNQVCISVPILIPEIKVGDKVELSAEYKKRHLCTGEYFEDSEHFDDGRYELLYINRDADFNEIPSFEYIFTKCV